MRRLAFAALSLTIGCSAALPSRVVCRLDALKVLPDDPMQVTPYDAVDLIQRIKACDAGADAAAP